MGQVSEKPWLAFLASVAHQGLRMNFDGDIEILVGGADFTFVFMSAFVSILAICSKLCVQVTQPPSWHVH